MRFFNFGHRRVKSQAPSREIRHFVHSVSGHQHANEDAVSVWTHPCDASVLLCALADGQGGQRGGAAAARLAVSTCLERASAFSVEELRNAAAWHEMLYATDEFVAQEPEAGYTTLVALCISGHTICGASCGDSAALLLDDERFEVLTEKQRKNPPLGSGGANSSVFQRDFNSGTLLLMSDGVWKYLGFEAIADAVRAHEKSDLAAVLEQMQRERNGGNLPDDFSLIVVG